MPLTILILLIGNFKYKFLFSGFAFLLASYTDYLDGKIARKKNLITSFGQIMDPMADKILISSLLICFVSFGFVPALAAIIIILREFIITSLRFLILQNAGKIVPANLLGKLKTISQITAIIVIFLVQILLEFNFNWVNVSEIKILQNSLIWVSTIFSALSGGMYIYLNRKFIISSFLV